MVVDGGDVVVIVVGDVVVIGRRRGRGNGVFSVGKIVNRCVVSFALLGGTVRCIICHNKITNNQIRSLYKHDSENWNRPGIQ